MKFFLHVQYASGTTTTIGFPTAFHRGLHAILLAAQPVKLLFEDR